MLEHCIFLAVARMPAQYRLVLCGVVAGLLLGLSRALWVTNRAACRAGEGKVQEFSLHAQARRPMRGAAHRAQTKRREKCRSQGVPQCGTQACVQERRTSETSTLRFFTFQPSSCTPLFPLQKLPDYLKGQWENFFSRGDSAKSHRSFRLCRGS